MSLLIQAIPQWSVVYTTCFETMWPKSEEKLNYFLGESRGLSVNLDRLCSLLHSVRAPSQETGGRAPTPGASPHGAASLFRRTQLPYRPHREGGELGLQSALLEQPVPPAAPESTRTVTLLTSRSTEAVPASVGKWWAGSCGEDPFKRRLTTMGDLQATWQIPVLQPGNIYWTFITCHFHHSNP